MMPIHLKLSKFVINVVKFMLLLYNKIITYEELILCSEK